MTIPLTTPITVAGVTVTYQQWLESGLAGNNPQVRQLVDDSYLLVGVDTTTLTMASGKGLRGLEALAFAVAEGRRQREETTRVTAQNRQTEAITKLAEAIAMGAEGGVESLVARLTGRTVTLSDDIDRTHLVDATGHHFLRHVYVGRGPTYGTTLRTELDGTTPYVPVEPFRAPDPSESTSP